MNFKAIGYESSSFDRPLYETLNWSIMADFQNLKYCVVAKILQNPSRFSKTLITRYSLPNHNVSGELERCNNVWMYPPLWTSLLVAMHNDIVNDL